MPFYDYGCQGCGKEFEVQHRMNERPFVVCPICSSPSKKLISACGIIVHNSSARRVAVDGMKSEAEARADLEQNYGVEKVQPTSNQSFGEIYQGIKAQGSCVRDQMQQKREENAVRARNKHRKWAVGANRRVGKKTLEAKERKASEAAAKRAIRL